MGCDENKSSTCHEQIAPSFFPSSRFIQLHISLSLSVSLYLKVWLFTCLLCKYTCNQDSCMSHSFFRLYLECVLHAKSKSALPTATAITNCNCCGSCFERLVVLCISLVGVGLAYRTHIYQMGHVYNMPHSIYVSRQVKHPLARRLRLLTQQESLGTQPKKPSINDITLHDFT